jgi:hypothetical protein
MTKSGQNWNINITGNSQNAFGDGSTFTQNIGGSDNIDFEKILALIIESIPEQHRKEVEADVCDPIRDIASEDIPEDKEKQEEVKSTIMSYLSKLEPYIPYIRQTVAAFADGALRSMGPPIGWVVGGLLEVIKDHRQ